MNEIIEQFKKEKNWDDMHSREAWDAIMKIVNLGVKKEWQTEATLKMVHTAAVRAQMREDASPEIKEMFGSTVSFVGRIIEKYPNMTVREFNLAIFPYICAGKPCKVGGKNG